MLVMNGATEGTNLLKLRRGGKERMADLPMEKYLLNDTVMAYSKRWCVYMYKPTFKTSR